MKIWVSLLLGFAISAGAVEFESVATKAGGVPERLVEVESFAQVWEARDQGWSSGEWGTPEYIDKMWNGFLEKSSADTAAHEGTHLLQAQIHNKEFEKGRDVEPIFVPERGVALVTKPPVLRKTIPARVPTALRGGRFELYVNAEASGGTSVAGGVDANILYLWNEWNAYLNGTAVTVEEHERGTEQSEGEKSELNHLVAPAEFFIYATATLAAAKDAVGDSYSRSDYTALKELFEIEADRGFDLLLRGDALPEKLGAKDAHAVLTTLRDGDDEGVRTMREFLIGEFGEEWVALRLVR